jgi:hypothetical protein
MRKVALLTTALIYFSAQVSHAQTKNWVLIGQNETGTWYIDAKSFNGFGNSRTVWVKKESVNSEYIETSTNFYVNCSLNEIGIVRQIDYHPSGAVRASYTSPLISVSRPMGTSPVSPDSLGEAAVNFVCSNIPKIPSVSLPTIEYKPRDNFPK